MMNEIAEKIGLELVEESKPTEDIRREAAELGRLLEPCFALMHDLEKLFPGAPPWLWPQIISEMQKDGDRYKKLVEKLIEGEFFVRGVSFIRLENDLITKKEFDAALD